MFTKFVLKVLQSPSGRSIMRRYTRNMIEDELQRLLEDPQSNTRVGMMRIIRGEVKDVIEENRERIREFSELDETYVKWAQERRQALLAAQQIEAAKLSQPDNVGQLVDPLVPFPVDQPIEVVNDALFEKRRGVVTATRHTYGFPEVMVVLEEHNTPISFVPGALRPITETEQPPAEPVDAAPAGAPTEQLQAVEQ